MLLDLSNPAQMEQFAELVAEKIAAKQEAPKSKSISLKEARKELNVSDDTLSRRIKAKGVRTWWENGGKAFARKDLSKLQ